MGAWLFGLNTAALILCCSIIEEMLETMYPKLTKTEKEKKGKLEALIVKQKVRYSMILKLKKRTL
jgi:hypothetical protein